MPNVPDIGPHIPWYPVTTEIAAAILGVHVKTLLRWYRSGNGPEAIDRDTYLNNQLYWQPAKLVEWWETRTYGKTRGFQQICQDWVNATEDDVIRLLDKWEAPQRPMGRHLRRRRRSSSSSAPIHDRSS